MFAHPILIAAAHTGEEQTTMNQYRVVEPTTPALVARPTGMQALGVSADEKMGQVSG
jgi:hypothetical protein